MVMASGMGPQEICTTSTVYLEGLRKKGNDVLSASGGHILKPEEMHVAHEGGHSAARSTLFGSGVLRSAPHYFLQMKVEDILPL